jgi:hypothetical protein
MHSLHPMLRISGVCILCSCLLFSSYSYMISEEIVETWPYFPRFHALYAGRPNVTPIAITTGIGPNGPRTQWVQRPDDYIHPDLLALSNIPTTPAPAATQPGALTASRSFGSDQTNLYEPATPSPTTSYPPLASQQPISASPISATPVSATPASRPPKPSTASRQTVIKHKIVQMVPKKRTLADSILDISKYVAL